MESLGAVLRRLRLARDHTLESLAELSTVSWRTISDIERGVSVGPQRRTLQLLADALEVTDEDRASLLSAARAGRTRAPSAAPAALPRSVADFTGRDREQLSISRHLRSGAADRPAPVVVVSGPPGFGKTSLAVKVATDLTGSFDAVHFVDLRGYDARPVQVLTLLNRLIHAVEPLTGPAPRLIEDAVALWRRVLGTRRVLLVLDNAATEDQVRAVLPATGPTAVVITSRGTLAGLEDVARVALDHLSAAESVTMLRRLLLTTQTDGQDLERLAILCGHVPLALRIAGNRLASRQTWTVDDLASRLTSEDRRIAGLRAGDLEIRAAIALSYDRLSERGRRTFRRLALLRGTTFGEALAARLVPTDLTTAEDIVDELADLGLVQPAVQGRYHLHDLLRLFARDRWLEEEPLVDRVAGEIDLRRWLLGVTISAGRWFEPDFGGAPPVPDPLVELETADQAQAWLRVESEHWFVALQESAKVGEHQLVIDVAESLHWFSDWWMDWGHWHEVFSSAVQAARALGDDDALATQLGYLSWAEMYTRQQPELALAHALEAGEIARRAGNPRQVGWAALYAHQAYRVLGRFDEALLSARAAELALAEARDAEGRLQARGATAVTLLHLGRYEETIDHQRRVLAEIDDPRSTLSVPVAELTRAASATVISTALARLCRWQETIDIASETLDRVPAATEVVRLLQRLLENRATALGALGRRTDALADQARLIRLHESLGDAAGAAAARALLDVGPE